MSLTNCNFTNAKLNGTSFTSTQNGCVFTGADYTTRSGSYMPYHSATTLKTIIRALATMANIPYATVKIRGLTDTVVGYKLSSQASLRAVTESLQKAYFFDGYEADGQINFISQSLQDVYIIPEADLGAVRYGENPVDKLKITDADIYEVPPQINLTYNNYSKNFAQDVVHARRYNYAEALDESSITVPIVMTKAAAQETVDQLLAQTWMQRTTYTTQLGNKWRKLRPGNVFETTVSGVTHVVQITKINYDGGILSIDGRRFKAAQIIANDVNAEPKINEVVSGEINMYFLDSPLLQETDGPGFYAAANASANFKIVQLYREAVSDPTALIPLGTIVGEVTAGKTDTVLGDGNTNFIDYKNTVTVTLTAGTLASSTKASMLNGGNAVMIGNEVLQFTSATLIAKNQYVLSGLLRGRRGTEWATTGHAAGEQFVLLTSDAIYPEELPLSQMNLEIKYRYGYAGTEPKEKPFTATGRGYRPYSVCHVIGTRDSAGNLTISWKRRTRINGQWLNNIDVPLSEVAENYQIDVMSSGAVKRTLTATTGNVSYTAEQQVIDFGSKQEALTVKIYQMSDKVGRGYEKEETV